VSTRFGHTVIFAKVLSALKHEIKILSGDVGSNLGKFVHICCVKGVDESTFVKVSLNLGKFLHISTN
jgi:hypothetical protein